MMQTEIQHAEKPDIHIKEPVCNLRENTFCIRMALLGKPIQSRDNPLFKYLRQLGQNGSAYRKHGQVWLEGDHLCRAALTRGLRPAMVVLAQSFASTALPHWLCDAKHPAAQTVVLPDALFAAISPLPSPAPVGFVMDWPGAALALRPRAPTVVLDRVQDAGNVGSILRSAAAFGFTQVIALQGTAALWSQKVLRAGMGAHFGLHLLECAAVEVLDALALPLLASSTHQGAWLHDAALPWPCAWALGHEGQGLAPQVLRRAALHLHIRQPGGEESLNVAAAAAICLYASSVYRLPPVLPDTLAQR